MLQVVLQALGVSTVAFYHFALRLQLGPTPQVYGISLIDQQTIDNQASERVWLHPHLLLKNIPGFLSADLPISQVPSDLRYCRGTVARGTVSSDYCFVDHSDLSCLDIR